MSKNKIPKNKKNVSPELERITSHTAVGGSPEVTSLHFISLLTTRSYQESYKWC